MKRYILIAGVNGAGKSTLYQALPSLFDMNRVNTDEIVKAIGDWKNMADVMTAGKIAIKRIGEYFNSEESFNQETTLCGQAILKKINYAKEKGYLIEMHYIGVDDVRIAKERVHKRVANGGHGIPDKDIERRYIRSFENLKKVMDQCNLIAFYDNTISFRRFAIYKNGTPVRISKNVPEWFEKYIH
ncbi:MAG: ATPase [Lachnospiraceae bacterium]|nr:ATPase [Lachnospiraceae bacterium]